MEVKFEDQRVETSRLMRDFGVGDVVVRSSGIIPGVYLIVDDGNGERQAVRLDSGSTPPRRVSTFTDRYVKVEATLHLVRK